MRFIVVSLILLFVLNIANAAELRFSREMAPGFHFSWEYDDTSITIQLTGPTLGWIGIGFSKTLTMANADLIIAGVRGGKPYVWDAWAFTNGPPQIDDEQQISIVEGSENGTHTTVTVQRPLVATGNDDSTIRSDITNVIWAFGSMDKRKASRYREYHGANRGHVQMILIREETSSTDNQETTVSVTPPATTLKTTPTESYTNAATQSARLPYTATLDRDQSVQLDWNFDKKSITLQLIAPSTGWIGVGFSQTASMFGADLILMGKTTQGLYVVDAHAEKNGLPDVDEMQNVEIISGSDNGTHTTMMVKRNLITCDKDDMDIKEGTYRVIWAYGEKDLERNLPSTNDYHGRNRGAKVLKLLNLEFADDEIQTEKFFDIRAENFLVPALDTHYLCKPMKIPDSSEKRHIVRYSPYLTPGNERNVHHIIIFLCDGELDPKILRKPSTCWDGANHYRGCQKMLAGWAVGMTGLRFPRDVGFSIGGATNRMYVILQTHYDNPEMKEFEDSSGIRFHYEEKLRKYDAGILAVDNLFNMIWVPPKSERYRVEGHCSGTCLSKGMENSKITEVTVLATGLHSHLAGRGMALHHYRKGKELKPLANDEFYDFDYQEVQYVGDKGVKIKKGDSLMVHCDYGTLGRSNVTTGGLATRNEMCIAFLFYYPELKLHTCGTAPNLLNIPTLLGLVSGLNLTISLQDANQLQKTIRANPFRAMDALSPFLNRVDWTNEKRKFAETYMRSLNQMPSCPSADGRLMSFSDEFPPPDNEEYQETNECEVP